MDSVDQLEVAWLKTRTAPNAAAARREVWALYMASREWAVKGRAIRERADGHCERCGADLLPLQIHHKTYIRRFRERPEDLLGVCDPCHRWLNGWTDVDPLIPDLLIADLMVPVEHSGR